MNRLEIFGEVVTQPKFVTRVFSSQDGNIGQIYFLKRKTVVIVTDCQNAFQEPSNFALLNDQVDIIENKDQLLAINRTKPLLFASIHDYLGLSVKKFFKVLVGHSFVESDLEE